MRLQLLSPLLLLFTFISYFAYAEKVSYRRYFKPYKIEIKTFTQQEIAPYSQQLFLLCKQVYQEYPYLYSPQENDGYEDYFSSLNDVPYSIAIIAFDKDQIIGAAIGIPINQANRRVLEAFKDNNIDLDSMYYLSELVLLPKYRKQGLGTKLYYNFEKAVQEMKNYNSIALCQIEDPSYDSLKPKGYVPNDHFWKKLGFVHYPHINFISPWANTNQTEPSSHFLVFWIKTLD